jgi:hypothetical protein
MEHQSVDPAAYFHVRIIMGMVLSLSIARLLSGVSIFIQHPERYAVSWIHIGWTAFMMLYVIHFWWFEFRLQAVSLITFEIYAFVIVYCSIFFLLCCLLYPNDIQEYGGYEQYFMARRRWFFGLLAFSYAADYIDTAIKGMGYFLSLGPEYPIRNAVFIALCLVAMFVSSRRFHAAFVGLGIVYQVAWILRAYGALS